MAIYTVTVVDKDSTVVSSYTVSTVIDFDTEDIDTEPPHDHYLVSPHDKELDGLGQAIAHDIKATERQKAERARKDGLK